MANYYGTTRTNYFRVNDEKEYERLVSGLCGEDNIHDFTCIGDDGVLRHGFGSYSSLHWVDPDDEENEGLEEFLEKLSKILPEDEAFILLESGYEKLRYVTGWCCIVTSKEIRYREISDVAIKEAREMLNDPDFTTQVDY